MIVDFYEENHTYALDGEIAKLSVTELLEKHGLAPKYIDSQVVRDSAEYGREIHKELEDIANTIEDCGYIAVPSRTINGQNFIEWLINKRTKGFGLVDLYAEKKLGINHKGLLLGGTADLIVNFIDHKGQLIKYIIDHKTTSVIHKKAVRWQVSILDFMNRATCNTTPCDKFLCLHYGKDGSFEEVELEKVPDSEIERLLDCELHDEIYTEPTLDLAELDSNTELQAQLEKAEQFLAVKEQEFKQAKADAEKIRAILLEQFEKQGVDKWVSPSGKVVVSYVKPTTTTTIDQDKLKTQYADVYKDCVKTSTKKGYVKVKINED